MSINYPDISKIYTESQTSKFEIKISENDNSYDDVVQILPDVVNFSNDEKKVSLINKLDNSTIMSNTNIEKYYYSEIITKTNGDLLICGLGLGLSIFSMIENSEVKTITVVEIEKEIIELVSKSISSKDINNKVSIENEDAKKYQTDKKFDFIVIDIWQDLESYKKEIDDIKSNYSSFLKENGEILTWQDSIIPKLPKLEH